MAYGSAFIFLLPFEIHTSSDFTQPQALKLEHRAFRVYPPFRNGEGLRYSRTLDNGSLPHLAGTARPATRLPPLEVAASPGWGTPFIAADAFRIDVQGLSESDRDHASTIGKRLLRLLRFVTRQWWILRGASDSIDPLQNSFPVDVWGQPADGSLVRSISIIPWLSSEVLLDSHTMEIALYYLGQQIEPPSSAMPLLDSIFAMLHDDKEQALLLAAIACESVFASECFAAASLGLATKKAVRRVVKLPDLRARIDSGLHEILGRSFADERPTAADGIQTLWLARHALAHGSPEQLSRHDVLHDQRKFADTMQAVFEFFEWLATIRERPYADPMRQFARPFTPNRQKD